MALCPDRLFGSHMVLQCGKRIRVWGTSGHMCPVNVKIQGQMVTAQVDTEGH